MEIFLLCLLFFLTSFVGVITGGNSLVNVPALILFGVSPHVAVATNMFGLTFFSLSGAARFLRARDTIPLRAGFISVLVALTLLASGLGALWMVRVESRTLQQVISAFMLIVAVFMLGQQKLKLMPPAGPRMRGAGYILAFLLGIYGGFFSGGYVTMLTFVLVTFFALTWSESVATTKFVNFFSSLIATVVFYRQGLISLQLGIPLTLAMMLGAWLGASLAIRQGDVWIRRLFACVVVVLALKLLWNAIR